MAEESLVDNIRIVANQIIKDKGLINLLILFLDETEESYTVCISAKWLDFMSPKEGTKLIIKYLFDYISKEKLRYISGVTAISTFDPSVQQINNAYFTNGGKTYIYNCIFGDVLIPQAIILESRLID